MKTIKITVSTHIDRNFLALVVLREESNPPLDSKEKILEEAGNWIKTFGQRGGNDRKPEQKHYDIVDKYFPELIGG